MKLKSYISSLLFLLFTSFFAQANDAINITGRVIDAQSKLSLPGAVVSIPDLRLSAATDNDGYYTLAGIPKKGKYIIQVTYIGYKTEVRTIDVSSTEKLDFALNTTSIEATTVTITGVTRATELKRSPVPIVAVDKKFIDERAASTNVIDQIANLPGVNAVTTGPNVSKPFIHGLGYNRVVTTMDGIRQEGQQWGDEHGVEVDQNAVDRVEVIKGPASLTYGPDAIGGVVNLLSPPPVPQGQILGSVQQSYGTNQGAFNSSLRLQGNNNGIVWSGIFSAKEAKNYQNNHDGRVYNTSYQEKDARVSLGLNKAWGFSTFSATLFDDLQEIPDGHRDTLTRQFTRQIDENGTYKIVPQSVLNSYDISTQHQHVQLYRIYNNSNIILGNGNLLINLGYQLSHRQEFIHPTQPDVAGLNLKLTTYTYDFKYNFTFGDDYETSFGVNGMYQDNQLGDGTAFPIPAYHQFDIGPFFFIKKSFGKLELTTGARFDNRSFSGQAAYVDSTNANFPRLYTGSLPTSNSNVYSQFNALQKNFAGFSGSFGAAYNVSDEFIFKANIARGFRSPSIAELSANGPDPGSQIYHIGNNNFKPEFSLQEDIGAFLALEDVSASAELFNNDISNYIYQQQLLDAKGNPVITQGYANYATFGYVQSKAKIYGGEFNLDIHPTKWLHFENSLTLTYGENKGNGGNVADSLKYLPFIPPLHTHSELRGSFNKGFGRFKSTYVFMGLEHYNDQNRFFSAYGTETQTAGYNLLSAGFGGHLTNKAGNTIAELFVEGTNLTNTDYQSHLSRLKYFDPNYVPSAGRPGIFGMGRNVSFKVVVPFNFSKKNSSNTPG
jgi:iron complex outermembrane receptor protein